MENQSLNTQQFYMNLTGFNDFSDVHNPDNYSQAPDDWFVIITDIKNSTVAIKEGRYKDVNTLGAATISSLQQALGTLHFPFVFGGDGATAVIHGEHIEKAKEALLKLQNYSHHLFGLELRLGIVSMSEVNSANQSIQIAKFFINPHKSIAMFRGGGLAWVDAQIKAHPDKYCFNSNNENMEDLEGLSCRWQPLESKRGHILTLLAQPANSNKPEIVQETLQHLNSIFNGDINRASPVQKLNMKYKSFSQIIKDEWNYEKIHFGKKYLQRLVETFICVWAFRFKLPIFFKAKEYTDQIGVHSDYRKFDDCLRLVIDCTHAESEEIEEYLNKMYEEGKIYYGTHYSSHSLMTCLIENLQQGGHIHFIDGGNGGYAMAAIQLKQQLKAFKKAN